MQRKKSKQNLMVTPVLPNIYASHFCLGSTYEDDHDLLVDQTCTRPLELSRHGWINYPSMNPPQSVA